MSRNLQLNLASEPFRRDRPMLAALAVGCAVLAGLLAYQVGLAVQARDEAASAREALARVQDQLGLLNTQQARLEATLRQPRNAEALELNLMLNSLLQRKGISWTRIFSDLEEVLPHNVRLVSIRPEVTPQNEVLLQMVVGAQSSEPVLQLLMALESSPLFGQTQVHNWLPPSQAEPLYRYRVSVHYAQKL